MKIKSAIYFVLFTILASSSFAKERGINPELRIDLNQKDDREEIHSFDFTKLFNDAEVYFKAAKAWNKLKCQPKNGFICTKHECKKRDIKTHLILDKKSKTITRCEMENCDNFKAEFEQTGVFFNIQSQGPVGTLIRVLGDNRYKEITTVGLDAYIANGECVVIAD